MVAASVVGGAELYTGLAGGGKRPARLNGGRGVAGLHASLPKNHWRNDMQEAQEEYRGYRIAVTPTKDCEDLWDFEYEITSVAGAGAARTRAKTVGGYATEEVARLAGIEVARIEIDNLLRA
jgi:hypothetical protein